MYRRKSQIILSVILYFAFVVGCVPWSGTSPSTITAPTLTSFPTEVPSIPSIPALEHTGTSLPPMTVSYYRLRFEYRTTSDWSTLEFIHPANILTLRLVETEGNPTNQDRQDGQFYRDTFEAGMQSDPDWIFLTSWNEWWGHTTIEPSEQYGDLYLEITRQLATAWKGE